MFYCDTSALTKLVLEEPESSALQAFLAADAHLASSEMARTELPRAVLRRNPEAAQRIGQTLDRLIFVVLNARLLDHAGAIPPPRLRSLDAIHLVSALALREELQAFVAYDAKLLDAASALGLRVVSPGAALDGRRTPEV